MSEGDRKTLRVKFDIAHFVVTQRLAFTNYPALCQLESKHGVEVDTTYHNENAGKTFCKTFCHFIAESRRPFKKILSKAQFFPLHMNGSTDTGNIDDEIFLVLWCDVDCDDQLVHTHILPLRFQTEEGRWERSL